MIEVIHASDFHIGYSQYHKEERRQDFTDAFQTVISDAISSDVNAVVCGGDIFHDSRPDTREVITVFEELKRLQEAGIPFLSVVGNHDYKHNDQQWLDLYQMAGVLIRLGKTPEVIGDTAFYGLDHKTRSQRKELDYQFQESDANYNILVAHGLFYPLSGNGEWNIHDVLESSNVPFDGILLGDDHTPACETLNQTLVTYPGSTERTAADQEEDRGYNVVTIGTDDTPPISVRRELISVRPFHNISVELSDDQGITTIHDVLDTYELDDAVVKLTITGDGESFAQTDVEDYALEQGALVVRTSDIRDFEDDDALSDVQFADPDAAAKERLDEMPLSDAALGTIDEVTDLTSVTKSSIQKDVNNRVKELVDDDPEQFTRPEIEESDGSDDTNEDSDSSPENADPDPDSGVLEGGSEESLSESFDSHWDGDNSDNTSDTADDEESEPEPEPDTESSVSDSASDESNTTTDGKSEGQTGIGDW